MKKIALFVIVLLGINTYSQKKENVYIKSVIEHRDSSYLNSYIAIRCTSDDILVDDDNMVKIDKISFAEDNLGNDLNKPIKSGRNQKFSKYGFYIYLKSPSRKAKSIRKITGTFQKTNSNKASNVNLEKFLSNNKLGTNIVSKKTEKAQIVLLTKKIIKDLESLEPKTLTSFVENKIIETADHSGVQNFIKDLGYDYFHIMQSFNHTGYSFYINDPDKEIVSLEMIDRKGGKSGYVYISTISKYKLSYLRKSKETLEESTLVIKTNTKGNNTIYQFEIDDVQLP